MKPSKITILNIHLPRAFLVSMVCPMTCSTLSSLPPSQLYPSIVSRWPLSPSHLPPLTGLNLTCLPKTYLHHVTFPPMILKVAQFIHLPNTLSFPDLSTPHTLFTSPTSPSKHYISINRNYHSLIPHSLKLGYVPFSETI